MERGCGTCFESIESAHEFLALLTEVVAEAERTIDAEIITSKAAGSRRADALMMARYNLEKLDLHIGRSLRILNDLRSLRRLLFGEREQTESAPAARALPEKPKTVHVAPPSAEIRPVQAERKPVPVA